MRRFTKPMQWVVLMVAAHMMLNVQSQVTVTGVLGNSINLAFTFNVSVLISSHIIVHRNVTSVQKVAEYPKDKESHVFKVYAENNSVSWRIPSATLNDSGLYWASVVNTMASKSSTVLVTIRKENTTSTVSAGPENSSDDGNQRIRIVAIVVVSAVVLMLAALPCFIWGLFGAKDEQQQQNQQSSNQIVQETASSVSVSAASVVYSVLEFPKRASALSDTIPNDTEYANISYAEKL